MTPPTVNAYYSPSGTTSTSPPASCSRRSTSDGRDAAVNYGGAGAVIGHELTHGFDDQGRKFDAHGNLKNWWTRRTPRLRGARACLVDQYSQYVVAGDTQVNGKLTLGENTADNGGLRLALMAYLAGPGATAPAHARRLHAASSGSSSASRRSGARTAGPSSSGCVRQTNPHSSGPIPRRTASVSNMPEFQKAFSCKADAPMVRQNPCRVW